MSIEKGNEITRLMEQIRTYEEGGFESKEELELRLTELLKNADKETHRNIWR